MNFLMLLMRFRIIYVGFHAAGATGKVMYVVVNVFNYDCPKVLH